MADERCLFDKDLIAAPLYLTHRRALEPLEESKQVMADKTEIRDRSSPYASVQKNLHAAVPPKSGSTRS